MNSADRNLARTVDAWNRIFATQTDGTPEATDGTPEAIANRIIQDFWAYNTRSNRHRDVDVVSLANALEAYRTAR